MWRRNIKIYQEILIEQEENIIHYQLSYSNLLKNRNMIVKSPSKRVSQLNLKFLDIRFMQVNENNLATTLPRISHAESNTTNRVKIYNEKGEEEQNQSYQIMKSPKQSIHYEDNTADASINYHTSILSNNQKNDISTDNVLRYLGADTNALYQSIETKVMNEISKKKKEKCSVYTSHQDSIQNRQLIKKYEDNIKNLQRQTQMVHSQIVRMYAEDLNKNIPIKSVSNLKLLKIMQNPKKSKNQYQPIDPRYKRKLDIFHSANEKGQKQKNIKDKIQKIRLPKIMKNKYENFYQDLYTQDRILVNPSQQSEKNNFLRSLSEAKKKFISNSYDKNFQAYLIQKKMRVPQILQKLR